MKFLPGDLVQPSNAAGRSTVLFDYVNSHQSIGYVEEFCLIISVIPADSVASIDQAFIINSDGSKFGWCYVTFIAKVK